MSFVVPELSLVAAVARNGAMGLRGGLPWPRLDEDMLRFRRLTTGGIVIMGRKTWESLPSRFRPLPGRTNIVLSRSLTAREGARAMGAQCAMADLDEALSVCPAGQSIFAIGGAEVFRLAETRAQRIFLTIVGRAFDYDVGWPWGALDGVIFPQGFVQTARTTVTQKVTILGGEETIPLEFVTLDRIP